MKKICTQDKSAFIIYLRPAAAGQSPVSLDTCSDSVAMSIETPKACCTSTYRQWRRGATKLK